MLNNINILKIASAMARHAADRHQVVSENIANADTANYRAKDLEPFQHAYSRIAHGAKNDELFADGAAPWRKTLINTTGMTSPNGNTVSLEDQMMRSIEAQQSHETATLIYKKSIELLRISLNGRA